MSSIQESTTTTLASLVISAVAAAKITIITATVIQNQKIGKISNLPITITISNEIKWITTNTHADINGLKLLIIIMMKWYETK